MQAAGATEKAFLEKYATEDGAVVKESYPVRNSTCIDRSEEFEHNLSRAFRVHRESRDCAAPPSGV